MYDEEKLVQTTSTSSSSSSGEEPSERTNTEVKKSHHETGQIQRYHSCVCVYNKRGLIDKIQRDMAAGPHVTTCGIDPTRREKGRFAASSEVSWRFTKAAEIHPKGAQLEVKVKDRVPKRDRSPSSKGEQLENIIRNRVP